MPQFAVYRSPGRTEATLFVLQIQSTRLDRTPGRVVMALTRRTARSPTDHAMTPHMVVQGMPVYADPLDIAVVPASRLVTILEFLSEPDQDRIIRAIDEMISRA